MKSFLPLTLGACLFLISILAQNQTPPPRPQALSKAEEDVLAVEKARRHALLDKDSSALATLIDEDFLHVTSTGDLRRKGHIVNGIKSGTISYTRLETNEVTVAIHEDSAIVTGVTARKGRDGKRDLSGNFRFIRTWMKKDGKWVLIAQANSRASKPTP